MLLNASILYYYWYADQCVGWYIVHILKDCFCVISVARLCKVIEISKGIILSHSLTSQAMARNISLVYG